MINHGFTLLTDPKPFEWIGASLKPHEDSHSFAEYMPDKFEAYVSFQHYFELDDTVEVIDPDMKVFVAILEKYTSTPAKAYMGVWEGYGWNLEGNFNLKKKLKDSCKIDQPNRKYFLIESTVQNILAVGDYSHGHFWEQFPNMIWPEDKSWYVFQEIDFDITLVGGSDELIREIEQCGHYKTNRFNLDEYMGDRFLAYWMESTVSNEAEVDGQYVKISMLRRIAMGIRAKFNWRMARGVSYYAPLRPTLAQRFKNFFGKD